MNLEIIKQYASDNNLPQGKLDTITRRSDPLDASAGTHIDYQGDISVYIDAYNQVVYKLGPSEKYDRYCADYNAASLALANEISVAEPLAQPAVYDVRAVYAAKYVEHDPTSTPDPEATGRLLAKLHLVDASVLKAAPSDLNDLASYMLEHSLVPETIKEAVETRCLRLDKAINIDMASSTALVHGDVHLGNILPSHSEPTLIDFEHSGRGSAYSDLSRLAQSAERFGLDGHWQRKCLSSWEAASDETVDSERLSNYVKWRCWYGVLDMIKRVSEGHGNQRELAIRLRWVLNSLDNSPWSRC